MKKPLENTFICAKAYAFIGVGLAFLVSLISVAIYGKVYFFNGYDITAIAWNTAVLCLIISVPYVFLSLVCRNDAAALKLGNKIQIGIGGIVVIVGAFFTDTITSIERCGYCGGSGCSLCYELGGGYVSESHTSEIWYIIIGLFVALIACITLAITDQESK